MTPDGTLKNILRLDYGFWESKDTDDDLEVEIAKKFDKGYPDSNILFEDSKSAILYQDGRQMLEASFAKDEALDELLTAYVALEHPEVREFKEAVERFKRDIPNRLVNGIAHGSPWQRSGRLICKPDFFGSFWQTAT